MDLQTILGRAGLLATDSQAVSCRPDPTAIEVTGLHYDTRRIEPGGVFFAIEGFSTDGHRFIPDALERGAGVIVAQKPVTAPVPVVQVVDSRRALAVAADRFFKRPSRQLTVVGITGTNGKTTCAYLIENILKASGRRVGVIGTVNYRYDEKILTSPVTTPESLDLQRIMAEMVMAGVTHLVLEVSSHAIDLSRIEACQIDVGVFTNLSQDHLDYHGDMQAYWACKKKLFTRYLAADREAVAVINTDSPEGRDLLSCTTVATVTTGRRSGSMIRPEAVNIDVDGIHGQIATPRGPVEIASPLVGAHNLENILSAVGVAAALGVPSAAIHRGIRATRSVPGRLERVSLHHRTPVYVDYAHTPDALENVLTALAKLAPSRIITVFGCGGDRDRTKRPLMGNIAARFSDLTIVTSDNPRSEDPDAIIDQILAGDRIARQIACRSTALQPGFGRPVRCREPDRRKAIQTAIRAAGPGDIVLIAGKGHETYQIVGNRTIEFDDRAVARAALSALSGEEVGH